MVVIKGKEKIYKEPISACQAGLSQKNKKKLRKPQVVQPIPTVCVS